MRGRELLQEELSGGLLESFMSPGDLSLWIEVLGYAAAVLTVCTYSMKTMIPLRITSLGASCLFILYGYLSPSYPPLVLHLVLLPLNSLRLYQMLRLVQQVKVAAQGELGMDWIRPFTTKLFCRQGQILFRKGDAADSMFYTVSGCYELMELGIAIEPGQVVGEIGLVAPGRERTQTFRCTQAGELLVVSYAQVEQLYFQNPRFGFYLLNLISQRLLVNIEQLEARLEQAAAESPTAGTG